MKWLYTILAAGVVFGAFAFVIDRLGDARYQAGLSYALKAQANTDLNAAIHEIQRHNDAYALTQKSLAQLAMSPDRSVAPDSIRSTLNSLCEQRKAYGVPCQSPRPSRKPVQ